jgi:hypothetical protein
MIGTKLVHYEITSHIGSGVWVKVRLAYYRAGYPNYDIATDGKRAVVIIPARDPDLRSAENHAVFLENFFDELRRKVPVNGK